MKMNKLKIQGITKRWVFTVLSVVLVILVVVEAAAIISLSNYTSAAIKDYLDTKITNLVHTFSSDNIQSTSSFITASREYAETFTDNDKLEIQFLYPDGALFMSTNGFSVEPQNAKADFEQTLTSQTHRVIKIDTLPGGEDIMTACAGLYPNNSDVPLGAIRVVVSIEDTNKLFVTQVSLIAAIGIVFFFTVCLSGYFFIRSIITPIRKIGATAEQIALGDFDARIEVSNQKDEIGRLCDTINYMAGELASTEKMKNEFISSVSHELRTPLTAIKGWGETVLSSPDDPEITKKGLEVMIGEAERLSVIVEDLLDFSRLQNGQLSYNMEMCDVVAELSEAVLTLTDTAKKNGVHIDFTEPDNLPPIMGDTNRLQQVFVNIIDNAIKYTPNGGTIVIDAKLEGGHILIMISDNGKGIPADDLEHVKQKFFKGKNATRGSGIGLAVANEIVQQHKGLLDIASTEHKGTTVSITLPIH